MQFCVLLLWGNFVSISSFLLVRYLAIIYKNGPRFYYCRWLADRFLLLEYAWQNEKKKHHKPKQLCAHSISVRIAKEHISLVIHVICSENRQRFNHFSVYGKPGSYTPRTLYYSGFSTPHIYAPRRPQNTDVWLDRWGVGVNIAHNWVLAWW